MRFTLDKRFSHWIFISWWSAWGCMSPLNFDFIVSKSYILSHDLPICITRVFRNAEFQNIIPLEVWVPWEILWRLIRGLRVEYGRLIHQRSHYYSVWVDSVLWHGVMLGSEHWSHHRSWWRRIRDRWEKDHGICHISDLSLREVLWREQNVPRAYSQIRAFILESIFLQSPVRFTLRVWPSAVR